LPPGPGCYALRKGAPAGTVIAIGLLAKCMQEPYPAGMSVQITIRNVPDEIRRELLARAAQRGQSMQEFLRLELERLASRPAVEEVLARMRERKALSGSRVGIDEILAARDADRK